MFRSYDHLQVKLYTCWFPMYIFRLKLVVRPKHVVDNLNKVVNNYWNRVVLDGNPWIWSSTRNRMQAPKFKTYVFCLKMVVQPKHVADNLNKVVNNYWNRVVLDGNPWIWYSTRNRTQASKFKTYIFCLKMVVRPKHVTDNLNKVVNNYWSRVALDGNPWIWSSTRNRMQTPKFKTYVFCLKMVVRPKHVADNLNKVVNNYWNRVVLDGNPWIWSSTRNTIQTPKFETYFLLEDGRTTETCSG
jgi:S-adenosylmethionine:diacylglycerol 3-amino-3-carboxypropyl transferase